MSKPIDKQKRDNADILALDDELLSICSDTDRSYVLMAMYQNIAKHADTTNEKLYRKQVLRKRRTKGRRYGK